MSLLLHEAFCRGKAKYCCEPATNHLQPHTNTWLKCSGLRYQTLLSEKSFTALNAQLQHLAKLLNQPLVSLRFSQIWHGVCFIWNSTVVLKLGLIHATSLPFCLQRKYIIKSKLSCRKLIAKLIEASLLLLSYLFQAVTIEIDLLRLRLIEPIKFINIKDVPVFEI